MTTRPRAAADETRGVETIECARSNKHRAGDSSSVPGDVGFVDVFALPASSSTLSPGSERLDDPDVELSLDCMHQAAPAEQTRYRCSSYRKNVVEAHFLIAGDDDVRRVFARKKKAHRKENVTTLNAERSACKA